MSVSFLDSSSCSAVTLYTPVSLRDCMLDSKGANLVGMTLRRLMIHATGHHDRRGIDIPHHWIRIPSPEGL